MLVEVVALVTPLFRLALVEQAVGVRELALAVELLEQPTQVAVVVVETLAIKEELEALA